jgi:GTPase
MAPETTWRDGTVPNNPAMLRWRNSAVPHAGLAPGAVAAAWRHVPMLSDLSRGGHARMGRMFLDRVKIHVSAGAGGDGAATFRQEAHVPRGGPDGGDGGRGGSIHLRVDPGQTTLRDFRFKHHFKATSGGRGERSRRHGSAGEDVYLDAPPGTAVYDEETGALVADLLMSGQTAMVARGGRGGLGNTHFKTSTHQAPKHAQKGEGGEERWVRLELRLIADIGLVGLPNAGKSTLLAALTAARPKIADYPFTTLEPNLGVMDLGDEDDRRPTVADVPGLIEGASSGAGLGHAFLRHVERTRILLHVVDGAGRDPGWDHDVIRDELAAHDPALLEKPILVVFNKLDLPAAQDAWPDFRAAREAVGQGTVGVSATTGEGLPALRARIVEMLPSLEELGAPPEPAGVVVHRIEGMSEGFAVTREEDGFRIRGKRIERIAAQTNFDVEESAERFQRDLARLGIDDELRRAGIVPGDMVRIGATELEWEAQPWELG